MAKSLSICSHSDMFLSVPWLRSHTPISISPKERKPRHVNKGLMTWWSLRLQIRPQDVAVQPMEKDKNFVYIHSEPGLLCCYTTRGASLEPNWNLHPSTSPPRLLWGYTHTHTNSHTFIKNRSSLMRARKKEIERERERGSKKKRRESEGNGVGAGSNISSSEVNSIY